MAELTDIRESVRERYAAAASRAADATSGAAIIRARKPA